MPSGKVHAALSLAVASGVAVPYLLDIVSGDPWMYATGCLAGVLVTPDLDVDGGMFSDTILRKALKPLQWAWRAFWYPYAKLIPHRHWLSHAPFIGTALRIGYAHLLVDAVLFMLGYGITGWWDWSFYIGLVHVDTIHYMTDQTIKGNEVMEEYGSKQNTNKGVHHTGGNRKDVRPVPDGIPRRTGGISKRPKHNL